MKRQHKVVKIIWWAYISLLLVFVIIKFNGSFTELQNRMATFSFEININLIPFATLSQQLAYFSEGWARFNIFGNIIPFMPFGFLLPLVYPNANSAMKVFIIGMSSILLVELFQLVTKLGSFDVDDIILNMTGIFVGYFIFWISRHRVLRKI